MENLKLTKPSKIKIKGITDEDFVNYKRASMYIAFPFCDFKCERECGIQCCQNSQLAKDKIIEIDPSVLLTRYLDNLITHAIVIAGLEPFDSFEDLITLVSVFREKTNDEIVIYTGYNENEIEQKISLLKKYPNIIVKYGRYIPKKQGVYDELLGITLASDNQYAVKIS